MYNFVKYDCVCSSRGTYDSLTNGVISSMGYRRGSNVSSELL